MAHGVISETSKSKQSPFHLMNRLAEAHIDNAHRNAFRVHVHSAGVGMSHISGQVKGLLSKITSVDQGNYPEMMGKTFIINAPGMFKLVWGIVKRFLDARTLTKIEACPSPPNCLSSLARKASCFLSAHCLTLRSCYLQSPCCKALHVCFVKAYIACRRAGTCCWQHICWGQSMNK